MDTYEKLELIKNILVVALIIALTALIVLAKWQFKLHIINTP